MSVNGPLWLRQRVWRVAAGAGAGGGAAAPLEESVDQVAVEEPLEIRVDGTTICITMRTPGADGELAAGFMVSEGVVRSGAEIGHIATDCSADGVDSVDVRLVDAGGVRWASLRRSTLSSSSCGLCGVADLAPIQRQHPPVACGQRISMEALLALPRRMREAQAGFSATGGLHAAALFDLDDGSMLCCREDIGRHNAVDKVVGWALLAGRLHAQRPLSATALCVSGRASFEIVQKALAAGIPILAAVSAPSSMAIDQAEKAGMTLAGFVRDASMTLYSAPQRVTGASSQACSSQSTPR